MTGTAATACPGCGGVFAAMDGPVHPYMQATPGCWAAFGRVLEREYADPLLFARSHRLTVDAYALQHPGDPDDRRAARSVWLHFLSLHLIFSLGRSHAAATALLRSLAATEMPPRPAAPPWPLTLADLPFLNHAADADRWAYGAYDGWHPLLGARAAELIA